MTDIAECPPNPDSKNDPQWLSFSDYLKENDINEINDAALVAYQDGICGKFLNASELNHCLTLRYFGTSSRYAKLAYDQYGNSEDDWEPQASLDELDRFFVEKSYRFTQGSVVYKGVGSEPFYQILDLDKRKKGDVIIFPGFLSTSVCREKSESFVRGESRLILIIEGLEHVNAIVPLNKCVKNSPTPNIPEQEILLNRGTSFTVLDKSFNADEFYEMHLKVNDA